jgi:hypothetical protein
LNALKPGGLLKTREFSFIHLFKNVINAIFHVPEKKIIKV